MIDIPVDLSSAVSSGRLLLFVGAGLSKSAGLPSFAELVDDMAALVNYDPDVFRAYSDDPRVLAEYMVNHCDGVGKLRSVLDRKWHDHAGRIKDSKVHRLITQLPVPLIYTTNYDTLLECSHDEHGVPYHLVQSAVHLPIPLGSDRVIVKFHGDFQSDESIVLTEESYFARLDFESPLDLLLRGHLLNRVVLFLGYSLSDVNIRYMLWRLQKIWSNHKGRAVQPKMYLFTTTKNAVRDDVLASRGVSVLTAESAVGEHKMNHTRALEIFLESLQEKCGGAN